MLKLDKNKIIRLVKDTVPHYEVYGNPLVKQCGGYFGSGFRAKWGWDNSELQKLSEKELTSLYHVCKLSWDTKTKNL